MTQKVRVVFNGKHRKGCAAIEQVLSGRWPHCWYYNQMVWRDSAGKLRGATTRWHQYKCNDVAGGGCTAEMLVHVDDVAEYALLAGVSPGDL